MQRRGYTGRHSALIDCGNDPKRMKTGPKTARCCPTKTGAAGTNGRCVRWTRCCATRALNGRYVHWIRCFRARKAPNGQCGRWIRCCATRIRWSAQCAHSIPLLLREEGVEPTVRPLDPLLREEGVEPTVRPLGPGAARGGCPARIADSSSGRSARSRAITLHGRRSSGTPRRPLSGNARAAARLSGGNASCGTYLTNPAAPEVACISAAGSCTAPHRGAARSPFPASRANRSRVIVPPPAVIGIPGVRIARVISTVAEGVVIIGISAPAPTRTEGNARIKAAVSISPGTVSPVIIPPGVISPGIVPRRPVKRAVRPVRVPVVPRAPPVIEPVEVPAVAVGAAVEILVVVVAFRYDGVLGALHHLDVIRNPLILYGAQLGVTTGPVALQAVRRRRAPRARRGERFPARVMSIVP